MTMHDGPWRVAGEARAESSAAILSRTGTKLVFLAEDDDLGRGCLDWCSSTVEAHPEIVGISCGSSPAGWGTTWAWGTYADEWLAWQANGEEGGRR